MDLTEIKNAFQMADEPFEDSYAEKVKMELPGDPTFPYTILQVALLKDALDVLDLTGGGIIFTTILSLIASLVLFSWMWGKISWWQKGLIKWAIKRLVMVFFVEFIPFLQLLPMTTIFVIMAHNREKKIVKLFYEMAEKLQSMEMSKNKL